MGAQCLKDWENREKGGTLKPWREKEEKRMQRRKEAHSKPVSTWVLNPSFLGLVSFPSPTQFEVQLGSSNNGYDSNVPIRFNQSEPAHETWACTHRLVRGIFSSPFVLL